jgi:putative Mg2+ transporter-C (MgtC) family protein
MHSVPLLPSWDVALRLVVAAALGGMIGIEREIRDREAGLRTHLLVAVGSALFTIVSAYGFHDFLASGQPVIRADPTRIAAQIVTGIGFLGAGAIVRQGISVRGLTTAASLWVVAAIGMAVGAGYYSAGIITTVLGLFALWPLRLYAYRLLTRLIPDSGRFHIELAPSGRIDDVLQVIERTGLTIANVSIRNSGERRMMAVETTSSHVGYSAAMADLAELDEVVEVASRKNAFSD